MSDLVTEKGRIVRYKKAMTDEFGNHEEGSTCLVTELHAKRLFATKLADDPLATQTKAALAPSNGQSGGYLLHAGVEPTIVGPRYESFQRYLTQYKPNDPSVSELIVPSLQISGSAADSNQYGGIYRLSEMTTT